MAIGDTVTFDCLPQAWPEPTIQWRRNGLPLLRPGEPPTGRRYSLERIAKTELNIPASSSPDRLNGAEAPLRPATASDQVPLAGGQEEELVDVFGSRLVIRQVEKSDEAKYSCLVETKGSHRLIERESPAGQLIASGKLCSSFICTSFIGPIPGPAFQEGRLRNGHNHLGSPHTVQSKLWNVEKLLTLSSFRGPSAWRNRFAPVARRPSPVASPVRAAQMGPQKPHH